MKQTPKKDYKKLSQAEMVNGEKYCIIYNDKHFIVKVENKKLYKLIDYDFAMGMSETWKPIKDLKDKKFSMCIANRMDIIRVFEELKQRKEIAKRD